MLHYCWLEWFRMFAHKFIIDMYTYVHTKYGL